MTTDKKIGIYIHIPFCLKKCNYCDFCSYPGKGTDIIRSYFDTLEKQIDEYRERLHGHTADTVYFGGGTPTLADPCDIGRIIAKIDSVVPITDDAEVTAECNPATADERKLAALRHVGVNRLSIGAQSFNDEELKFLGRLHTSDDIRRIFHDGRSAGFCNISLDLMYGIPLQTKESWQYTLDEAVGLRPEHISAYGLKVEEGTPFGRSTDKLPLPDEDDVCDMYRTAVETFGVNGLVQYEISNFAKPGYESKHNLKYWHAEDYIGLGAAAYSTFEGKRFSAPNDIDVFMSGNYSDDESIEIIDSDTAETEYVMLAMRLSEGLVRAKYKQKFGCDPTEKYGERFERFVRDGFVAYDGDGWHFTTKGFLVSNTILAEILDLC